MYIHYMYLGTSSTSKQDGKHCINIPPYPVAAVATTTVRSPVHPVEEAEHDDQQC